VASVGSGLGVATVMIVSFLFRCVGMRLEHTRDERRG
jgi:hypothetical protein